MSVSIESPVPEPILTPSPNNPQAAWTALGSSSSWARDFAILGALSTSLGLYAIGFGEIAWFVMTIGLGVGALTGAILGGVLPDRLARHGPHLPSPILVLAGPIIGGFWGATAGALTVLMVVPSFEAMGVGAAFGGVAGALQLAWFWPLYLAVRMRGGRAWPLLVLSGVTPLMGGALLALLGGTPFGRGGIPW